MGKRTTREQVALLALGDRVTFANGLPDEEYAELLAGATSVTRAAGTVPTTLQAYRIDRAGRAPVLVFWDHRDAFAGEDEPPVAVTWPWPAATASVTDVFGQTETVQARDGQVELKVGVTPVFITRSSR